MDRIRSIYPVNDSSTRFLSAAGITFRLVVGKYRLGAGEIAHTA